MGDVKVERRHREAALKAVAPEWLTRADARAWIDRAYELHASSRTLCVAERVAHALAAAEQRTREECAAQVEAMAARADVAAGIFGGRSDALDKGGAIVFEQSAKGLRGLAERMRGGGGV